MVVGQTVFLARPTKGVIVGEKESHIPSSARSVERRWQPILESQGAMVILGEEST